MRLLFILAFLYLINPMLPVAFLCLLAATVAWINS